MRKDKKKKKQEELSLEPHSPTPSSPGFPSLPPPNSIPGEISEWKGSGPVPWAGVGKKLMRVSKEGGRRGEGLRASPPAKREESHLPGFED